MDNLLPGINNATNSLDNIIIGRKGREGDLVSLDEILESLLKGVLTLLKFQDVFENAMEFTLTEKNNRGFHRFFELKFSLHPWLYVNWES